MMRTSSIAPDFVAEDQSGFTLIEMLVTLSLIALVAAFALPRLASDPANSRPATIARISDTLADAAAEAQRTGRTVRIDPASLGSNVGFAPAVGQDATIRFFSDGSSNGGTIAIGDKRLLAIDWLTGRVHHVAR